jgi:hypothetical protein
LSLLVEPEGLVHAEALGYVAHESPDPFSLRFTALGGRVISKSIAAKRYRKIGALIILMVTKMPDFGLPVTRKGGSEIS